MKPNLPTAERWTAIYRPTSLEGSLEIESTLFAIRLFEAAKLHNRLIRVNTVADDDVLALLGFTLVDDEKVGTPALLHKALAWQQGQLEAALQRDPCRQVANLRKLCAFLRFDEAEQAVAYLGLMLSQSTGYQDLVRISRTPFNLQWLLKTFAQSLGMPPGKLRPALKTDARPARMGLIDVDSFGIEELPTASEAIRSALELDDFDTQVFLRRLVRPAQKPKLALDDFAHVAQLPALQGYLRHAAGQSMRGVNILLYGMPGTGKTEFTRALAAGCSAELFEVPNESDEGRAISGAKRFAAYSLCQQVLAERSRPMVLFDEAEDVFEALPPWTHFDDDTRAARGKCWINEMLESNAVPAIWTCNTIGGFDPAWLRRFDFVMEMRSPPRSVRRRIVERYFEPGEISAACADRLAAVNDLAPANIERAARVVHALEDDSIHVRDATAMRLVEDTLRAMGGAPRIPAVALPSHYDPAFVNADRDIDILVNGLRIRPHARVCLYGPPGTGKTAFAHHLGQVLDIPVLVRRGSDLLSMFVGGTEALIAEAFQSARDDNAILVIDEADGFLRDRAGASHGWEVTQVNELLTQMEAFEGIFIASTNLMESLDAAALRRFDFKSRFGYLKPAQRRGLLARVCGIETAALAADVMRALDRMDLLTPGDFANVLRQLAVLGEPATPAHVTELLAAEVALKPEARHRQIGFTT